MTNLQLHENRERLQFHPDDTHVNASKALILEGHPMSFAAGNVGQDIAQLPDFAAASGVFQGSAGPRQRDDTSPVRGVALAVVASAAIYGAIALTIALV